jgi:hypothetical protein
MIWSNGTARLAHWIGVFVDESNNVYTSTESTHLAKHRSVDLDWLYMKQHSSMDLDWIYMKQHRSMDLDWLYMKQHQSMDWTYIFQHQSIYLCWLYMNQHQSINLDCLNMIQHQSIDWLYIVQHQSIDWLSHLWLSIDDQCWVFALSITPYRTPVLCNFVKKEQLLYRNR